MPDKKPSLFGGVKATAQNIIIGIGIVTTFSAYYTDGFGFLSDYFEDERIREEMFQQYKENRDNLNLPFVLLATVSKHDSLLKEREGLIDKNRFLNNQTQEILFGELEEIQEYDGQGNRYVFWENNAGDYWLIINGLPYIMNYNMSRGYWYYTEYPTGKVIRLKPMEGRASIRQEYTDEELDMLEIE